MAQQLGAWPGKGPHDRTNHRDALRARLVAHLGHLQPCDRLALAIHALDARLMAHTNMVVVSTADLGPGQRIARALDDLSTRNAPIRDAPAFLEAALGGYLPPVKLRNALVVGLCWSQALHHGALGVVDLFATPALHGLEKAAAIAWGARSFQQRWTDDPITSDAMLEGMVSVAQSLRSGYVLFLQESLLQDPSILLAMLTLGLEPSGVSSPMIEETLPYFHEPPSAHRLMYRASWKGRVVEAMALEDEEALAVLRAW